jgi:hypothetical protein
MINDFDSLKQSLASSNKQRKNWDDIYSSMKGKKQEEMILN